MNRLSLLVLLLAALVSVVTAASAPTFCKCTCFTNSTIIEIKSTSSNLGSSHLKEPSDSSSSSSSSSSSTTTAISSKEPNQDTEDDELISSTLLDTFLSDSSSALSPRSRKSRASSSLSPSCNQCNRAFCLSQSLPICKGAAEKDVVTMCFQRDSRKDMIIVWGFLLGTTGLLGWAALRNVMEVYDHRPGSVGGQAGARTRGGESMGPSAGAGRGDVNSGGGGIRAGLAGLGIARSGAEGRSTADAARGRYVGISGHSRDGSTSFN